MNSHVFMDQEFQNRHRLLNCEWAHLNVVVRTKCPKRVTMVDITLYVM